MYNNNNNKKNNNNKYKSHNKHGGNNRGKYRNNDRNRKREKTVEEHERDYLAKKRNSQEEKQVCPVCDKEIYIIEQSIKHRETGKPAHFDCVLNVLRDSNDVDSSENIVYLGAGSFGIIKERRSKGSVKFFVRKRIMYEDREKKDIREGDDEN